MNKEKNAYEELKKGIRFLVEENVKNINRDVTLIGRISKVNANGTYNAYINNIEYKNIPTIGGSCENNETVNILIKQNNYNDMIILKSTSSTNNGNNNNNQLKSEVENIRIGANGTVYDTAGDAVRGQISLLEEKMYETKEEVKSPINKCYFNYSSGLVIDEKANNEINALKLSKQSIVVTGLDLNNKQREILKRARELNPKIKIFKYISVHTQYFTFDELKIKMQEMKSDTFDGVFFDEFDTNDSLLAMQQQGNWNSVIEKQNALVDYAHSIGLNVFANPWLTSNLLSGEAGTIGMNGEPYNPNGIKTTLNNDDIVLFESNEYYPDVNDNTDYVYWSNVTTSQRIYDYKTNWYDNTMPKSAVYCYRAKTMTEEENKRAMSWILYNSLAMGCDYVYYSGVINYEMPDNILQFYSENSPTIEKIGNGNYRYSNNGHTLNTLRWSAPNTKVNMNTLKNLSITIDGETFQNAFLDGSTYAYQVQDKIESVENDIQQLRNDYKEGANPYIRMFIDDWIPQPTINDYTNIVPDSKGTDNAILLKDVYEENYRDFKLEITNPWGSYYWVIDAEPYRGKTIEFGFKELSYSWGDEQTNFWCSIYDEDWEHVQQHRVFPTTKNQSKVGNKTGLCVQYYVKPTDSVIRFNFSSQGVSVGNVITVKGLYAVDVSEIKEFNLKDKYTNKVLPLTSWQDRMFWIDGEKPYTVNVVREEDESYSLTITYNENGYTAWSGITIPLDLDGLFLAGSRWELGCSSIETNSGENIRFRIYNNRDGFFDWFTKNTKNPSEITNKSARCLPIAISELVEEDINASYIELCNISDKPYYINEQEEKVYYTFTIKGLYLYNPNEEDVVIRGETPANSWLQIARVTEEALLEYPNLQPNALYFTDDGKMFITDFSKNKHEVLERIFMGAVNAGYNGTPEEFGERLALLISNT